MKKILNKQIFYNFNFHILIVAIIVLVANWGLFYYDTFPIAQAESGALFYPSYALKGENIDSWGSYFFGHRTYLTNSLLTFLPRFFINPEMEYPFLLQFSYYLSLFYIGIFGFYKLLCFLIEKNFNKTKILYISLIILFNPATLSVLIRFLYDFISLYFLLPVTLYLTLKCFKSSSFRDFLKPFLLINLILSSFSIIYSSLACFVVLFVFWAITTFSFLVSNFSFKSIKNVILFFIFWFFLNSFWILPFLTEMYYKNTLNMSIFVENDSGNTQTLLHFSKKDSGFLNIFRLMSEGNINNLTKGNENLKFIFSLISLFPIILIVLTLFYLIFIPKKNLKNLLSNNVIIIIFLFLIFFIVIRGANFPFTSLYLFLFNKLDFLQVFRNSYEKGLFIFYLPFLLLFSIIIYKITENHRFKKLGYFILISYLIINSYFFYSSRLLLGNTAPFNNPLVGFKLKVPEYYFQASKIINKSSNPSYTLVIPTVDEGIKYNWDYGYSGVDFLFYFLSDSSYSMMSSDWFKDRKDLIKNLSFSMNKNAVLNLMNFEYTLFRFDYDFKAKNQHNPEITTSFFLKDWVPDFESLTSINSFELKAGPTKDFRPIVDEGLFINKNSLGIEYLNNSDIYLQIVFKDSLNINQDSPFFILIESPDIKKIDVLYTITGLKSENISFRRHSYEHLIFKDSIICQDCFITEPILQKEAKKISSLIFKVSIKENIDKLVIRNISLGSFKSLNSSKLNLTKLYDNNTVLYRNNNYSNNLIRCYSNIEPYENISRFIYHDFDPKNILYIKKSSIDYLKNKEIEDCTLEYLKLGNDEYIIDIKPKDSIKAYNTMLNFNVNADSLWKITDNNNKLFDFQLFTESNNHFFSNSYSNSFYLENIPPEGKKYRLIFLPSYISEKFQIISLALGILLLLSFIFLNFKKEIINSDTKTKNIDK